MGPSEGYDRSVSQALEKGVSAVITGIHAGNTQTIAGIGPGNVDSATGISGIHTLGDTHQGPIDFDSRLSWDPQTLACGSVQKPRLYLEKYGTREGRNLLLGIQDPSQKDQRERKKLCRRQLDTGCLSA